MSVFHRCSWQCTLLVIFFICWKNSDATVPLHPLATTDSDTEGFRITPSNLSVWISWFIHFWGGCWYCWTGCWFAGCVTYITWCWGTGLDMSNPMNITKHPAGAQKRPITIGIVSIPPTNRTPPIIRVFVFAITFRRENPISAYLGKNCRALPLYWRVLDG